MIIIMDYIKEEKRKKIRKKKFVRNIVFSLMAIMLCILTIICIVLLFAYNKEKNKAVEVLSQKTELEQQMESGNYISQYESDKLVEEAANEREEKILSDVRSMMESGTTTLTLLETLYPENIVTSDGGRYYFFDINKELAQNPYTFDKLIYPVLNEESKKYEGDVGLTEQNEIPTRKGIDVSKFQGNIDWKKVSNDGIEFAYIRLGYRGYGSGKIVLDEKYEDNIVGCNEAGIDAGVYFFTEAISEREAIEEADYVLENIRDYKVNLPIVIDVEESASSDSRTKDLTKEERTSIVKAFCNRIIDAGHEVMIYGNMKSLLIMMDMEELENYDKWFAYYKYPLRFPYKMKVWQYTATGKVDGIKGDVDINIEFY